MTKRDINLLWRNKNKLRLYSVTEQNAEDNGLEKISNDSAKYDKIIPYKYFDKEGLLWELI